MKLLKQLALEREIQPTDRDNLLRNLCGVSISLQSHWKALDALEGKRGLRIRLIFF
jgi:hypothetical protein